MLESIKEKLISIGKQAFEKCIKLKSIDLTDNLEYIGDDAYFNGNQVESFGKLQCVNGNIYVDEDSKLSFENVEICGQKICK